MFQTAQQSRSANSIAEENDSGKLNVVPKKVYEIDGAEFESLELFYDFFSAKLIPNAIWGRNLDALNDVLRGGFGTPEEGFILRWKNAELSKERLGYGETIRQLQLRLAKMPSSE